jgi:hypothetical protein
VAWRSRDASLEEDTFKRSPGREGKSALRREKRRGAGGGPRRYSHFWESGAWSSYPTFPPRVKEEVLCRGWWWKEEARGPDLPQREEGLSFSHGLFS